MDRKTRGERGGKGGVDERQGRLVIEKREQGKKVSFKGSHGLGDEEVREEIRKEIRREIAEWKKEIEGRMEDLECRMLRVEKYIEESNQRERKEREEENSREEESEYESRSTTSKGTRLGSRRNSIISMDRISRVSECLSDREIGRIKRFMVEKEKEERRNNIVIKGWEIGERITNERAEEFIKKELGVEVKVKRCRLSGRVIVVSLEGEERKREIMSNKKRLKGKSIYIENDLTWEERKVQEKMSRWAKEEREKGKVVKIGFARVMVNGKWRRWEEIEEEKVRWEERERDKEIREREAREERREGTGEGEGGEERDGRERREGREKRGDRERGGKEGEGEGERGEESKQDFR